MLASLRVALVGMLLVGFVPPQGRAQTVPSTSSMPTRPARELLREELDSLWAAAVVRPYGVAFSEVPEAGPRPGVATKLADAPALTFDTGGTPAAGVLYLAAGELLNEPKYREAAVQVSRCIAYAMDPSGRVPSTAAAMPGQLSQKEKPGQFPKRSATFGSTAFLLLLDRSPAGQDTRVASTTVRATNWVIKQQIKPGFYATGYAQLGEAFARRVIRLDQPDTRDAVLTLLMVGRTAEGRETSLPVQMARQQAQRAVEQLLRMRISDMGRPSRYLWQPAFNVDGTPLDRIPDAPAVGNMLATRYALQTLVAYYLDAADASTFAAASVTAQAVIDRKGADDTWTLVDDPRGNYPPPRPAVAWERGDFGLPPVLRAIADLRVLGPTTFGKVVAKTMPAELSYAAVLTGLCDQLPMADLPISASQVAPYVTSHPEMFDCTRGPMPVGLTDRCRRIWALYLLARWDAEFGQK